MNGKKLQRNGKMSSKPKILFVYDHPDPSMWMDGLSGALDLLEKDFEIEKLNLNGVEVPVVDMTRHDFILAHGAFHSKPEEFVRKLQGKKGLCIGGNAIPPYDVDEWDIYIYETDWYYDNVLKHYGIEKLQNLQKKIQSKKKK